MNSIANVLQVAALGVFTAGAFMLAIWLGLMVLGLALGLVGYVLDPERVGGSE